MRTASLLCTLLLLLVPPARADEPAPAPPEPEAVGRELLAADPAVRERAEAALLEAVLHGADPAGFVRRTTSALREWADREERLVEAWIELAVRGTSAEQERAVRLLTALGETAVKRLARELREARASRPPPQPVAQAAPAPPVFSEPAPAAGPLVAGTPGHAQIYDVADLLDRGQATLALLSLARRSAESPEVLLVSTRLVVTATPSGHERLGAALAGLRSSRTTDVPQSVSVPGAPAPSAAALPAEQVGQKEHAAPPAMDPPWALYVWAVSVTAREIEGLLPKTGVGAPAAVERRADGGLLARGPAEWASAWAQRALRSADALPLGEATLDLWEQGRRSAHLGQVISYRRSAVQAKGGAWAVETDEIRTGLTLNAGLEGAALDLEAVWVDLASPMAVEATRPAPSVDPVELDRPDWSAARGRVELEAPAQGVAALCVLPGLLRDTSRRLVLVVSLLPR